jgi:cyclic pyranopterin phosphate synthase
MSDLTHFNLAGRPSMVDVSGKEVTLREATATGRVYVNPETFELILSGGTKKGDVLCAAQLAGIMGAKRCHDLIPMCHPVAITGADISFEPDEASLSIGILATIRCKGETGVEMEALTAVSIAALTVYDMCKAVQRDIRIDDIRLVAKSGGKSGDYNSPE